MSIKATYTSCKSTFSKLNGENYFFSSSLESISIDAKNSNENHASEHHTYGYVIL